MMMGIGGGVKKLQPVQDPSNLSCQPAKGMRRKEDRGMANNPPSEL